MEQLTSSTNLYFQHTATSGTRPQLPLSMTGRLTTMKVTIYGWSASDQGSLAVRRPLSPWDGGGL
jgi:hypothetical protein